MANKQYFRVIQTGNGDENYARNIQEQKLNNYAKYKQPWTNEEVSKMPDIGNMIVPDFDIDHVSTATSTKDYFFIITTTLCCHDEEGEEKGEKY